MFLILSGCQEALRNYQIPGTVPSCQQYYGIDSGAWQGRIYTVDLQTGTKNSAVLLLGCSFESWRVISLSFTVKVVARSTISCACATSNEVLSGLTANARETSTRAQRRSHWQRRQRV